MKYLCLNNQVRHFTNSYKDSRFSSTQLVDRICQLCDTQEVEDEIHSI